MHLLLLLLSFNLWANDSVYLDPIAALPEAVRNQVLNNQIAEFARRLSASTDCSTLLAPLAVNPAQANLTSTPIHRSYTFVSASMEAIKNEVPTGCQRELAQNLMIDNDARGELLGREILLASVPLMASDLKFCGPTSPSPLQDILRLADGFEPSVGCRALEPGQWNRVNKSAAFYDTLSYAIQRLPDTNEPPRVPHQYRAVLNLRFTTSSGAQVNQEQMLARVRQCLSGVQGYLGGRVNSGGEVQASQLQIDVLTNSEAMSLPPAIRPRENTVTIGSPGTRSTVRSFASDISCDTIVHEVMHLLGLCDEYPGEAEGFPCRPVGRPTGLMRNEALAFASTIPMKLTCDCSSALCRELTQTSPRRSFAFKPGLTDFLSTDFRVRYCRGNQLLGQPLSLDLAAQRLQDRFSASINPSDSSSMSVTYSEIEANGASLQVVTRALTCTCSPLPNGTPDHECQERIAALTNPTAEQLSRRPRSTMSCPAGSTAMDVVPQSRNTSPPDSGFNTDTQGVIELFSTPQQDTLFEPRHMNQIINGNCIQTRAAQQYGTVFYNNCASLAYQRNINTCRAQVDSGTDNDNRACLNRYNWGQPCSVEYGGRGLLSQSNLERNLSYTQDRSDANCTPPN